jgi:cupin fold WbuC family metalloprotein
MSVEKIPKLSYDEIISYFFKAKQCKRKRFPKILHEKGDYNNRVINFVLQDSYMQPHLHPGVEKIEKMYLLKGSFALILFDENGEIYKTIILKLGQQEFVDVPAFTWHTYVMLTKEVVIYETMDGVYEPSTWKKMAPWAPEENDQIASKYHASLIRKITL